MRIVDTQSCGGVPSEECDCRDEVASWYRCHGPMIRRFVIGRWRDPCAADDIMNETFTRAIRYRRQFRCQGRGAAPWLVSIARNVLRDVEKKASTRREVSVEIVTTERIDNDSDPALRLETRERYAELLDHVAALPQSQRDCVRLRFFDGKSVEESAKVMRRSPGALRALQHRAVRTLAEGMGRDTVPVTVVSERDTPVPSRSESIRPS